MQRLIRWPALLTLSVALGIWVVQTASQNPATRQQPNPDALLLVEFQERIDQYMELHKEVDQGSVRRKTSKYRIVDKHLILRDVDANLIVDFIPNAIR